MTTARRYRTALRLASVVLGLALFAFLTRALWRDGPAAWEAWRAAHVHWPWIAVAISFALIAQGIPVVGWRGSQAHALRACRDWTA